MDRDGDASFSGRAGDEDLEQVAWLMGGKRKKSSKEKRAEMRRKVSRLSEKGVILPQIPVGNRKLNALERASAFKKKDKSQRSDCSRRRNEKRKEVRVSEGVLKKRKRATAEGKETPRKGKRGRRGGRKYAEKKALRDLQDDAPFQEYLRSGLREEEEEEEEAEEEM